MTAPSITSPHRRLGHRVDAYKAALAVSDRCDIADFLPPRSDRAFCLSWSSVNVSADETTGKDTILPRVGRSLAG
jgi:hypothetical protein